MASLANSSKHLKNYYLYFSNFKKKKMKRREHFLTYSLRPAYLGMKASQATTKE